MMLEENKQQIDALIKKMADAWAAGDGEAYGNLFWDDARYVEAPGFRVVGSKMIGERHQRIFDTFFKGSRIEGGHPGDIQELTPDVVIVHMEGNVLFPGEDGKKVNPNGLVSMCLLRKNDIWKIASLQNTPTGKFRTVKFMLRFLSSRFRFRAASGKIV